MSRPSKTSEVDPASADTPLASARKGNDVPDPARVGVIRDPAPESGPAGPAAPTLSNVPIDPDDARELSRAAQMARTWLANRDQRIRQAHAKGAGLREIARLVGMTHPAVIKIVAKGDTKP